MRDQILKVVLIIILLQSFSYSQSSFLPDEAIIELGDGWYKTSAWVSIHDDMTMGQAREKAKVKALKNIVEYYCGVEVSSTSLSIVAESNLQIGIDHFSQITNTMSQGLILKKEIIEARQSLYNDESIYTVTLKAKTGKIAGERDPLFKIEANLNREQYQSGDDMVIDISSTKDCFIFVFNILSDESVISLLPNQYLKNNFIQKGSSIRLPPEEGIITRFRVGLAEDKSSSSELIMVIGIKAKEDMIAKDFEMAVGNYNLALNEIMEFVLRFHRDQIEQVNLHYTIHH